MSDQSSKPASVSAQITQPAQPVFQRPAPAPVPLSPIGQQMAVSDIERLLQTGDKLLKSQQEQLVVEEAAYETKRTQIMNEYNSKVAKLDHETKEVLFQLHLEHEGKIAEIKRLVTKLTAMREA